MARVGRPSKLDTLDLKQVEKLAGYGLTEEEIGDFIGVSRETIDNWKRNPKFLYTLKKGKLKADVRVTESLYSRAIGYDHEDTYFACSKGEIISETYIKHWPPDVAAAFIWLKNRRGWKDNPDMVMDADALEVAKLFATMVRTATTGHPTSGDNKVSE